MAKYLIIFVFALISGCSEKSPATGSLDGPLIALSIMPLQWPKTVVGDSYFVVPVLVRNSGRAAIPSEGKAGEAFRVRLGYHWKLPDERVLVWDGQSVPLLKDLKVGDQQTLYLMIKAPPLPGSYILDIDAVQNSAFWFYGVGSQSARFVVSVK